VEKNVHLIWFSAENPRFRYQRWEGLICCLPVHPFQLEKIPFQKKLCLAFPFLAQTARRNHARRVLPFLALAKHTTGLKSQRDHLLYHSSSRPCSSSSIGDCGRVEIRADIVRLLRSLVRKPYLACTDCLEESRTCELRRIDNIFLLLYGSE